VIAARLLPPWGERALTSPTSSSTSPHLRHPFSSRLEDSVIDELMGHAGGCRGGGRGGSRVGARYRHTTPGMAHRVVEALQARLAVVLRMAEAIENGLNQLALTAF
jgi:hypothetical protein